jgi:hypothetical protein
MTQLFISMFLKLYPFIIRIIINTPYPLISKIRPGGTRFLRDRTRLNSRTTPSICLQNSNCNRLTVRRIPTLGLLRILVIFGGALATGPGINEA